ncbi:MAG: hypothetical protein FWC41_11405 [Firmicutes bacterium]|nr:hypothetical protein [Bacillota bacterium]
MEQEKIYKHSPHYKNGKFKFENVKLVWVTFDFRFPDTFDNRLQLFVKNKKGYSTEINVNFTLKEYDIDYVNYIEKSGKIFEYMLKNFTSDNGTTKRELSFEIDPKKSIFGLEVEVLDKDDCDDFRIDCNFKDIIWR